MSESNQQQAIWATATTIVVIALFIMIAVIVQSNNEVNATAIKSGYVQTPDSVTSTHWTKQ